MADAKSRAYIFKVVSTMLGESSRAVEDSAPDDLVAQFLDAKVVEGKKVDKLLFYAQDKTVICTTGDKEPLTGKCAYVVRVTDEGKPVTAAETDINFGTINGDSTATLQTLTQLMSNVYDPCLASNLFGYMKKMKPNEKEELETLQKKCVVVIDKAISSLAGGMKLAEIDPSDPELKVRAGPGWVRTAVRSPEICPPASLAFPHQPCRPLLSASFARPAPVQIENKPAAIQAAAANPSVVAKLEGLVTNWCEQMEKLFNEAESPAGGGGEDGDVQGPRSELEHWRSRMGKLNSIIEQLRGEQCRMVLAVLQARYSTHRRHLGRHTRLRDGCRGEAGRGGGSLAGRHTAACAAADGWTAGRLTPPPSLPRPRCRSRRRASSRASSRSTTASPTRPTRPRTTSST